MLFGGRIRRMAHDLSNDATRHFYPLGKTGKGAAQPVQGYMREASNGQGAIVSDARLGYTSSGCSLACEYPGRGLPVREVVFYPLAVQYSILRRRGVIAPL